MDEFQLRPATEAFLDELLEFEIQVGNEWNFEGKQRLIERAQSHAIREAYAIDAAALWQSPIPSVLQQLARAEAAFLEAGEKAKYGETAVVRFHGLIHRHRQELVMALYTFICQHLESRRSQVLQLWAAFGSMVLAVVAIGIAIWLGKP